jgi:hypothetical protein
MAAKVEARSVDELFEKISEIQREVEHGMLENEQGTSLQRSIRYFTRMAYASKEFQEEYTGLYEWLTEVKARLSKS